MSLCGFNLFQYFNYRYSGAVFAIVLSIVYCSGNKFDSEANDRYICIYVLKHQISSWSCIIHAYISSTIWNESLDFTGLYYPHSVYIPLQFLIILNGLVTRSSLYVGRLPTEFWMSCAIGSPNTHRSVFRHQLTVCFIRLTDTLCVITYLKQ